MNTKLQLSLDEALVLDKLARRSKMDSWFGIDENHNVYERENFGIDENYNVYDKENKNRKVSARNACKTLIYGLTTYDIEVLDKEETLTLINLALRL
jgi:hypothetical protein